MTLKFTISVVLISISTWSLGQKPSNAENTNEKLLQQMLESLTDSGSYNHNGNKQGQWAEYSIDNSLKKIKIEIVSGEDTIGSLPLSATLIKETGEYKDGERKGIWLSYRNHSFDSIDWELKTVTHYLNGHKNGWEKNYVSYPSTLSSERHYSSDKNDSIKNYYSNGKLWLLGFISDSGELFTKREYFESGQLETETSEIKNSEKELHRVYNQDGFLTQESELQNGKYNGLTKFFYPSGAIKARGIYLDTLKVGNWTAYYETGQVQVVCEYKDGKINGSYKFYHANGQLWTELIYKDDKPWEVISNFDKNGISHDTGSLTNGTGTIYYYKETGELSSKVKYKDGIEINE